ncbi:MAG TPA: dienelactone hydrolase family protein, partial [Lacunisphaera sp.]|nr:dienelactone hydrolase family protein [Lacunisphaera sp.]
ALGEEVTASRIVFFPVRGKFARMNPARLLSVLLVLSAALSLPAKIVTKPVAYEHAGVKLEGYLAYDDAKAKPGARSAGVLVVPEWWGLTEYPKSRAEQLAKLGYVAFAVDMYGAGVVTDDPKRAGELAGQFYGKPLMAERAQAGLDQLLATGLVDATRVAAIGYCFGGSTVQALAYTGAPLAGVVSFHGGLIPVPADAAAKTKAKILVCHGAVDGFVPPESLAAFTQAMNDGKFDYQFISYAGAVHAFTNPKADAVAKATGLPIAYHPAADRRSWGHMKQFFKETLGDKK